MNGKSQSSKCINWCITKKNNMFKKGNVFGEQKKEGWIYGYFMPEGIARDDRVEIKVAKFDNSFTSDPHYNRVSTKIDIVWNGNAIWQVNGEDVEMRTGDYLIIRPKTTACIKKILSEFLIVQTIKIPSIPDDKVTV